MEVPMYISSLVVEVTRRCNIQCEHCLRGDAQKVDISKETIDNVLKDVTFISGLTITGGEPTLAIPAIKYLVEQIIKRDIELGYFYVVTNGKVASKPLMHILIDLYAHIGPYNQDDEMCGLVISGDQYHRVEVGEPKEAKALYKALTFFRADDRQGDLENVLTEGRAKDMNGSPVRQEHLEVEKDITDEVRVNDGNLYINALGDVVSGCDFSYESQEDFKIGNVNETSLKEIMTAYANKQEAVNV
jgi:MoaA/NifB/PqqE/SkfB family radical SAM enzyme